MIADKSELFKSYLGPFFSLMTSYVFKLKQFKKKNCDKRNLKYKMV